MRREIVGRIRARSSQADDATMSAMPGRDPVNLDGPGVKLTYDDFVLFPDDGKRHEIIDGEHYVTPSPSEKHQRVVTNLIVAIGGWLKTHAIGRIYTAPFDTALSNFDVVEPELPYVSDAPHY